ncbi:grasp-with-spasm system SPASM domain peptide maturase [Christiangramia marina]|uniref:grasp-with-spasm system SPASM domain peptide maturase n=1 Tax=Christiangramia marina TaxID=409436 RepID=UPI003AA933ED
MVTIDLLLDSKDQYVYLFSDCFLVKGHTRTMICDVSRKKMYFINNPYFEVLEELKCTKIGDYIHNLATEDDLEIFCQFLNYLFENQLATIVTEIDSFPPIEIQWDSPHHVSNAIIDIRDKDHPFGKIFMQLDHLLCPHVQIRSYKILTYEYLHNILCSYSKISNFRHIQILTKYSSQLNLSMFMEMTKKFPMISIVFHSVPEKDIVKLQGYASSLTFINEPIDSCKQCGIINKESLGLGGLSNFMENMLYNGCLNRKISIDENGNIKNCPSMTKIYGNIADEKLEEVIEFTAFKNLWTIKKDEIKKCQDCEYRYVCTDCRAYLEDETDIYSKPLKCDYDPYQGTWK